MLKLVMMRGLPGSGKSTKAKQIAQEYIEDGHIVNIFSTDDFWGDPYTFVQSKIREAHQWNQNRTIQAMQQAMEENNTRLEKLLHESDIGLPVFTKKCGYVVIVDNTNVCAFELKPYIKAGVDRGFDVEIIEPSTDWAFDADQCANKTVHSVPVDTIRSMLSRWDKNVTLDQCLKSCAPWERK